MCRNSPWKNFTGYFLVTGPEGVVGDRPGTQVVSVVPGTSVPEGKGVHLRRTQRCAFSLGRRGYDTSSLEVSRCLFITGRVPVCRLRMSRSSPGVPGSTDRFPRKENESPFPFQPRTGVSFRWGWIHLVKYNNH